MSTHEFSSFMDLLSRDGHFYYEEDRPEVIQKWINNPMTYHKEIKRLSRRLYSRNGVYTNVVDYMRGLLTLDRVVYATENEAKSVAKSIKKANAFAEQIRDKIFVRDTLHTGLVDGEHFAYLLIERIPSPPPSMSDLDIDQITEINEDGDESDESVDFQVSLSPLPNDYVRIVGRKNSSYVIAFDMEYFNTLLEVENKMSILKTYPKEIRDGYLEYKRKNTPEARWKVLDNDYTFALKSRAKISEPHGRPIGLAAIDEVVFKESLRKTKQNVVNEVNNEIIVQTLPEGKNKGESALSQKQQQAQHEFVRDAVRSKRTTTGTTVVTVASGTKLERLKANTDIFNTDDNSTTEISSSLGFAASLLNGMDGNYSSQQGNAALVSAQVFEMVEQIEYELNKLLNIHIIKQRKYEVKISYLPVTHLNRKEMVQNAKELYTLGRGSLQAWIAAAGFKTDVYLAMMDYEVEQDFENKYPIHQTAFTATNDSGEEKESGRPIDNDSTNESTLKGKSNGTKKT